MDNKGFTLIDPLVSIVILSVFAIAGLAGLNVVFGAGTNFFPAQRASTASENLVATFQELGASLDGFVCSGTDSDGNNYITCTVRTGDQTMLYECPYSNSPFANKRCKADRLTQFGTPSSPILP